LNNPQIILTAAILTMQRSYRVNQCNFPVDEATIDDVHAAIASGRLTCRQLVKTYLARIKAYDQNGPKLNAVICINPAVLAQADALDRFFLANGFKGPLHGIPVLLKDNIFTTDMPTTGGSLSFVGFIPPEDAFITTKLHAAGAIILAKVNLHEFAIWGETISSITGQTLNPYDLTRTPGGSSGGTGAALAANFGIVGIGTDTINSVRSPASANNLVGLRPTIGLVSRSGIIPYSLTQDTAGPMARTVRDTAKILDVIAGYDPRDPVTAWSVGNKPQIAGNFFENQNLAGTRLGIIRSLFGGKKRHQEVNTAVANCLALLEANGATLVNIDSPAFNTEHLLTEVSVHLYDLRQHLNAFLKGLGSSAPFPSLEAIVASGKFHQGIWKALEKALQLNHEDPAYNRRLILQKQLRISVLEIMASNNLDALVYPHQRSLVASIGQTQLERNGVLAATTGFPAITVPGGFSPPSADAPIGIPIGLEFLGRPWTEGKLLKLAYSLEQAAKFRRSPASTPPL
jgi:Asp-tRNA(Asn)/Glu-tRNA(Gln) amidotransferase A subunit family amidase